MAEMWQNRLHSIAVARPAAPSPEVDRYAKRSVGDASAGRPAQGPAVDADFNGEANVSSPFDFALRASPDALPALARCSAIAIFDSRRVRRLARRGHRRTPPPRTSIGNCRQSCLSGGGVVSCGRIFLKVSSTCLGAHAPGLSLSGGRVGRV